MSTSNNESKTSVDLTVAPESAIEFMHEINNQQLPWSLNMEHEKTAGVRMVFGVEQDNGDTGMQIVLNGDGTWTAVFAASIKLEN